MVSRIENILQAMIDGTSSEDLPEAQSRNEALLLQILDKLNESDVDPEVIAQAVSDWLDDHPEATTTVEDGSISYAKLDVGLKAKADDVDSLKSTTDSLETYVRNMSPVATVTAPVASVSDAAPLDAEDVTIAIEPVQDLHGYDNPWPAGGGKNLTDYSTPHVAPVDTTATVNVFTLELTAGETYTYSCLQSASLASSTRNTIAVKPPSGSTIYENSGANFNPTNLRHVLTFTPSSDGVYTFMYWGHTLSASITLTQWQVEKSSSFTGYAPYSNICPISGWTGANINHGADQTNYDTISITFPTEAGTVYGGTLDLTKGKLVVDRAMVDMGMFTFRLSSTKSSIDGNVFTINISALGMAERERYTPNQVLSSRFATAPKDRWYIDNMLDNEMFVNKTNLFISASQYDTASDFNTAMSGVQLVYELATPITYDLTPQEIAMFRGANNVWADTGDTTLVYRQDVAMLLSELISG